MQDLDRFVARVEPGREHDVAGPGRASAPVVVDRAFGDERRGVLLGLDQRCLLFFLRDGGNGVDRNPELRGAPCRRFWRRA